MGRYIADSSKCPRISKVYIYTHYDLSGWNNNPAAYHFRKVMRRMLVPAG